MLLSLTLSDGTMMNIRLVELTDTIVTLTLRGYINPVNTPPHNKIRTATTHTYRHLTKQHLMDKQNAHK